MLPPVDWTHVLNWWDRFGIGRNMTWSELDAWNRATKAKASPFELELLMSMNSAYTSQLYKTEPALSPPYDPRTQEEKAAALNKSFAAIFAGLPRAKI